MDSEARATASRKRKYSRESSAAIEDVAKPKVGRRNAFTKDPKNVADGKLTTKDPKGLRERKVDGGELTKSPSDDEDGFASYGGKANIPHEETSGEKSDSINEGQPEAMNDSIASAERADSPSSDGSGAFEAAWNDEAWNQNKDTKPSLLDLPDESLLHILEYCKPREIKALGFTCMRLSEVCRSRRALWTHVDLTDIKCGRRRLATYIMGQYLNEGTLSLAVRGYSDSTKGCQGRKRDEVSPEAFPDNMCSTRCHHLTEPGFHWQNRHNDLGRSVLYTTRRFRLPLKLPRLRGSPVPCSSDGSHCSGPRWTLHSTLLTSLGNFCPQLTELRIEYCNLDCDLVRITDFPTTLKKLSLKGTRCYDTPLSQTYLFKIHDRLAGLESMDVSHCTWLSASYLLSLSKMPNLKELIARSCHRLGECVAYSSLAARYGFKQLEILDIRETPMGDSEVSALGWLPKLRELYLQAPPALGPEKDGANAEAYFDIPIHSHEPDEEWDEESDIEDWELPDLPPMGDSTEDWLVKKSSAGRKEKKSGQPNADEASIPDMDGDSSSDLITQDTNQLNSFVIAADPTRFNTFRIGLERNIRPGGQANRPAGAPDEAGPSNANQPNEHVQRFEFLVDLSSDQPVAAEIHPEPPPANRVDDQAGAGPPGAEQHRYPVANLHLVACMGREEGHSRLRQDISDPQQLVSDYALLRFGRSRNTDILHLGPNGVIVVTAEGGQGNMPGGKPDKSSLEKLVCVGFRRVTDRALRHLSVAAPRLTYIDVRDTSVTAAGAEAIPLANVIM